MLTEDLSERIRSAKIPDRVVALPYGYTATFQWRDGMHIDWAPAAPRIQSARHRQKFLAAYRAARDGFIADVAAAIGGNVLVMDGETSVVSPPTKQ
jgi:hypothetical protein